MDGQVELFCGHERTEAKNKTDRERFSTENNRNAILFVRHITTTTYCRREGVLEEALPQLGRLCGRRRSIRFCLAAKAQRSRRTAVKRGTAGPITSAMGSWPSGSRSTRNAENKGIGVISLWLYDEIDPCVRL